MQLQIEAKRKMLGRSVAFGVKSVEKHLIRRNFFELTTPEQPLIAQGFEIIRKKTYRRKFFWDSLWFL